MNNDIDKGTQIPYIKRAMKDGFGVMVLNTNLNYAERNGEKVAIKVRIQLSANNCYLGTVKRVFKDHPRDQQNVVLIHRWFLYAGSMTWKVYAWGPVKCGLYKQVVFIYRWSLEQVQLCSVWIFAL